MDLDRIAANFRAIRSAAGGARVFPVVKANAYGHGAVAVALALERAGADALCVALLEEGLELRAAGMKAPILVIGSLTGAQIGPAIDSGLIPAVYRADMLDAVEAAGRREGRPGAFHLKVDTGMSRLGLPASDLPSFLDRLSRSRDAKLEGVFSNLACGDHPDDPLNAAQMRAFDETLGALAARGIDHGVRHLANSSALELIPSSRYDAVRPGILIYGVPPLRAGSRIGVKPALTLVSEVIQVRDVPIGTAVGYGASYRVARPSRLATIPAGYDDGVIRSLSNRSSALVGGRRATFAGRISMDLAVLDVTDCGEVETGDEVVLIGSQGTDAITAWETAVIAQTIPWEVLCRIGGRVPRDYYEGGRRTGRWSRWVREPSLS